MLLFTGTLIGIVMGPVRLVCRRKCKVLMNFVRSSDNDKIQIKGKNSVIKNAKTLHTV